MDNYRFDLAAREIYELIWNCYCDWYVELCKPVLNDKARPPAQLRGTRRTLVAVMEAMLRLAHPIMPFITEEIWQRIAPPAGKQGPTIMTQPYPKPQPEKIDEPAEKEMRRIMEIVLGIRKLRGENNIPPGQRIAILMGGVSKNSLQLPDEAAMYIETLARTKSIAPLKPKQPQPDGAMIVAGDAQIILPLDSLSDIEGEIKRANKELDALKKRIARSAEKLSNRGFVEKAPAAVVEKEKERLDDMQANQAKLEGQLKQLRAQ